MTSTCRLDIPARLALNPSWAILVRKSAGAVDGVEGLAQVVGEGVGGGDGLASGWIWMVR
jgi:hypothetical protein